MLSLLLLLLLVLLGRVWLVLLAILSRVFSQSAGPHILACWPSAVAASATAAGTGAPAARTHY